MTKDPPDRFITSAIRTALRPIVGFALRHSIRLMDFIELLKAAYLDAGVRELHHSNTAPNISRLSVMTGVHRRDAARLFRDNNDVHRPGDLITRVVGQWKQSSRFTTSSGRPRTLTCEGLDSDFAKLVRSITADVAPYTVLHELEHRGLVERSSRGIKLVQRNFVVPTGDYEAGFNMIAEDVHDLICAGEQNLSENRSPKNLHLKTEFDNVPESAEAELRAWLLREGSRFHEHVEAFLAKYDRDTNPALGIGEKRVKVRFATFSYISEE